MAFAKQRLLPIAVDTFDLAQMAKAVVTRTVHPLICINPDPAMVAIV